METKPLRIPNTKKPAGIVAQFKDIDYAMACAVYRIEQERDAKKLAHKPTIFPVGLL